MTQRALVIAVVVLALAGVGGYVGLVKPQRDAAAAAATQLRQERDTLAAVRATVQSGQAAKATYRRDYARVVELGKAVPSDDDLQSLLVQLSATARATGVRFDALERGTASTAAPTGAVATGTGETTQTALPPGATVGASGFPAIPLKLTFSGRYFELADFLGGVGHYVKTTRGLRVGGRLLTIDGVSMSTGDGERAGRLTAIVTATAYLVSPVEGATAGATASGPAQTGAGTAVSTTPTPNPGSAG